MNRLGFYYWRRTRVGDVNDLHWLSSCDIRKETAEKKEKPSTPCGSLSHVEVELPSDDDSGVEEAIRKAIPLGGRYVSHSTYVKTFAKVSYESPT